MNEVPRAAQTKPAPLWKQALAFAGSSLFAASFALAAPSTSIVISQVYGAGGNVGATYKSDFIELHNNSTTPVNVAGWSVQYAAATSASWTVIPLSGTIQPGAYYLAGGTAGSNGITIPTPEVTFTVTMAAGAGKVALSTSTTALAVMNPTGGATIVDFVGFGTTANAFEGAAVAPTPNTTNSIARQFSGSLDTDNNSTDFVAGLVTPRNSLSPIYVPGDTTPPIVTTFSPANNATGVAVGASLSITFDESVSAGTGNIVIKKSADDSVIETLDVPGPRVTAAGTQVTIDPTADLASSTSYYVQITNGAIVNPATLPYAGISDKTTWTFTTAGVDLAPTMLASSPADDGANVLTTTDLSITFSEIIVANSGTILVKKSSDNSTVETVTVPSAQVQVTGSSVAINRSAVLDAGTSYYVEVSAGAFKDVTGNSFAGVSGNAAWNFTTRTAPLVLISQYYEGSGSGDRYIELKNLTASELSLTGYRLASWSDTAPSDNEGWKSGNGTTSRVTPLDGYTIPANGSFLVAVSGAAAPAYAANNYDVSTSAGISFNGDDSIVLYNGIEFTRDEVVDAVSISASEGTDTSFYRLNDLTGFDFTTGTSILNYSSTWGTKTIAEVGSASETDAWYLKAKFPAKFVTLGIAPSSFSEGAGVAAATATITRSGPTDDPLEVLVTLSDDTEAAISDSFVTIPIGAASTTFAIDAVNDPYLDGDQQVIISISAYGFTPDSKTITVLDELADPVFPVVINEVDTDQTGTDSAEFIELYNNSNASVSLDGVVLVLYEGTDDLSDVTIDLTGETIEAHGYFVIGSATVPNVDLVQFTTNGLGNGPDAVALYLGTPAEFPSNTAATTSNGILVDAVVYDTNQADDAGLLAALTPGKPQINENQNSAALTESISRVPDGGAALDTTLFVARVATPGATNNPPPSGYATWASVVGGQTADLDYDGDGLDNGTEYFMGTAGNAFTQNPGVVAGTVTWPRATGTTISSFRVEVSTNLTFWENATVNYAANLNTANPAQVVFTMPGGPVKLFVRLSVMP